MNGHTFRWWCGLVALAIAGTAPAALAQPQDDPDVADVAGMQVLTRGPVHEAFAEPLVFDPKPGPVIPREPPPPIEERPPDQRPEGASVQWIPGYWSWDDTRGDFVWVSGVWRDVPPGRQWVPGYWSRAEGGAQWVPGAWVPIDQGQAPQYLPPPPQSVENGPNGPPPSADATWSPGTWVWQEGRYVWRPGFWVPFREDWVWVPAHYVSTPSGSLFVDGYWDLPLQQRGVMFAPVYFQQPLYNQPNYTFTPTVSLLPAALASALFVRPAYHQYYFGDYYAANNFQSGIYPWYSYHQSRYGYDPIFTHYSALQTRRDPGWVNQLHEDYRYRREHPEARPPRTFALQRAFVQAPGIDNRMPNLPLARSFNQVVARPFLGVNAAAANRGSALRFERVDEARRQALVQQGAQFQQFRQQRIRQELEGARRAESSQPRRIELPRSPIMAPAFREPGRSITPQERARFTPPPFPAHPRLNPEVQQRNPGAAPLRFEPHPDRMPPNFQRPGQFGGQPFNRPVNPGNGRPEPRKPGERR